MAKTFDQEEGEVGKYNIVPQNVLVNSLYDCN